jgi:hypothetical protein
MEQIVIIVCCLGKEHWIGLNNIFDLTQRPNVTMQLRITMEDFAKNTAVVYYDEFYLADNVRTTLK